MIPGIRQLDPVLGLDLHLVQPPFGPPVSVPIPFVGVVFDPLDFLPGEGATPWLGGMPGARVGSAVRGTPHVPIGGVFLPAPPASAGQLHQGSASVGFGGEPACFAGLPVLTCQSSGAPAPARRGRPRILAPLGATSSVLAIPGGAPVLIGGEPRSSLVGSASGAYIQAEALTGGEGLRAIRTGLERLGRGRDSNSARAEERGGGS